MTDPERISSGVALSFPANDGGTSSPPCSTKVLPRRLRQRLLLEAKSPPSAEEIDAKLKEANLRRQQFYELVSSRARSSRPSQEEVLGQQLEAKLNTAEQKRCWRQFVKLRNKTFALAEAFVALEINEESVKSMPFELLALKIESAASIQIVKALADCLESHFRISRAIPVVLLVWITLNIFLGTLLPLLEGMPTILSGEG
ncbi:hypothetical protein HS088_TW08G00811 [Tripterygium wilfordii]|uniref:Uncharacterized protein n=1 Tax=Tripterygium wilfordii TaxID=458696 RepID=A0A7J7DD07_TRIWF|nr:hypothetical protein HS088_TW08G00811 [Tripterygium wilfordii]